MNPELASPGSDASAEIARLIEVLNATDQRLEELLGGEIDSVTALDGRTTMLRRAQRDLRHREDVRQAAILNALPATIALLDTQGTIVSVNEAWRRFGNAGVPHAPGHAMGLNYLDVCEADCDDGSAESTRIAQGIRAVIAGDLEAFEVEYPCHSPGQRRWCQLTATSLGDIPPSGLVVMHVDITARREASDALTALHARTDRRERMLSTMLSSIADFAYIYDREGRFLFANKPMLDMWGLALDDVVGRKYGDLPYEPEVARRLQGEIDDVVASRRSLSFESPRLTRKDEPGYFEYVYSPVFAADGSVDFVVGTTRDITQRKRSELALRESYAELRRKRAELQLLFDLLPAMIWFKDPENNILRVNKPAAELANRSVEEIEDRHAASIHPEAEAAYFSEDRKIIESGLPMRGIVRSVVGASGAERWVLIDKVPYRDESGAVAGLVVVAQDITQRKRDQDELREMNVDLEDRVRVRTAELTLAREEAEQANRAKSAFLATMSHEIRTPMNGVIGMIEVLHQTSLQGYQVEMIELIRDSAFSLLQIIEDILDFSKIEAGKLLIEQASTRVAVVVERACALLDHVAVRADVRLAVFVDPAIPHTVIGDETRLRQVLVNLGSNAIKFSSGGHVAGQVSIRVKLVECRAHAVTVDFIVSDNGIGMDEAALGHIFTPFAQADASTTRRFGGTGLGLAICNMLVKAMDGEITVQSTPGEGSTFRVRLQFAQIEEQPPRDTSVEDAVAGLDCRIIGGERPLGDDIGAYLAHAGVRVAYSPDPASAAEPGQDGSPALWIVLPDQSSVPVALMRALANRHLSAPPRFLVLGHGKRRRPRVEAPDVVVIDADTLLQHTLLKVVALASGRTMAIQEIEPLAAPRVQSANPLRESARRQGRLILVAEDNETNRKVIERQLNLLGFACELVVNGRAALERWRTGAYALVLTDLHMPEMDGYALAGAIRAEETDGRRTPIVALTANALREEELRCRQAGMDGFVTKPVRLAQLKLAVEQWLDVAPNAGVLRTFAASTESGPLAVDLSVLTALVGDEPEVIAEVLECFRESALESSAELAQGAVDASAIAMSNAAHKLKSAARSIGAIGLGDLCEEIEQASIAGPAASLDALKARFDDEFHRVLDFVDARRGPTPPDRVGEVWPTGP